MRLKLACPFPRARSPRAPMLLCATVAAIACGLGGVLARPAQASGSAAISGLRLVDYFPASAGWGYMWWNWNAAQIDGDFARIAALHANTVRIVVSASAFRFPSPTPAMLDRLSQTLSLAAAHGLRVELTLFNEWHDYAAIQDSRTWARELLASLRGDPRIAYIDLHNELPSDVDHSSLAWAQAMVPYVQSIDGGIPVTVSTSISSGTAPLEALIKGLAATPPDLYDVHYYGNAADAYATLARAKSLVGGVPLLVGETGFSTDPSYGWARGLQPSTLSLESYQDYYFRVVESATRALALPAAAPWILYDMPGQGGTTWGFHMGILHVDGSPKPAATTLAELFSGGQVGTSFNNGFELSAGRPAQPTIWRRWMAPQARFTIDRRTAHSGLASARISHAGGNHNTGCPAYFTPPVLALLPGMSYTASAWVRGRGASGQSRVVLSWSDASGHYIASSNSSSLPAGDSGWTRLSVSAPPPPGAAAVEIDLQVCENPGSTWFDDVGFSPAGAVAGVHHGYRPPRQRSARR
jgi:hypothetical protein